MIDPFYSFSMLGRYGRLGNQMFQVAAMICLARRKNCNLALPNNDSAVIRKCFNIPCIDLDEKIRNEIKFSWEEPNFSYQKNIDSLPYGTDVLGYLQSWKYITEEDYIRKIFSFKEDVINASKSFLPKGELIAVHVRRGDYLKFPEVFPLPDVEYYRESILKIRNERPNSIPVLFTDDKNWCSQNMGELQNFSTTSEIQDMCSMSLCTHHVIANSSYSWWGAWLAKSKSQIVYSPSKWFGLKGPQDSQDLLPNFYRKT